MDKEIGYREEQPDFEAKKRKYFSALGIKLKEALKLHKEFGLLKQNPAGKKEWGNVSEHCLAVAARTRALAKLIGLSESTTDDVVLAAGAHDFYKKSQIEKTPKGVALSMQDYLDSEKEAGVELAKAGFSQKIIDYSGSIGSGSVPKIQNILNAQEGQSEQAIASLIIHYVDDYTIDTEWVKPAEVNPQGEKINDLNRRITKARNNPKYKSIDEEGRAYFNGKTSLEAQEETGQEVEKFLAARLAKLTGIKVGPKDLPAIIDQEIKKEVGEADLHESAEAVEAENNWEKKFENVMLNCLHKAYLVHERLGKAGEEIVQKNQFGETAVRADIECEDAVLNFLTKVRAPIRVMSEEHGQVDITEHPKFLGILDGLDGSEVFKRERGTGRYGTMFGIFNSINPNYNDYLVSGIMEHSSKKLYVAIKGQGLFVTEHGGKTPAKTSGKTSLGQGTQIYQDTHFEINRQTFSPHTKGFKVKEINCTAICYADVASGKADIGLECTRKGNLEIAIAYALITEAGGAMVDLKGESLGDKKYLEFGQTEKLPIITAATKELALAFLEHLKK